jgi:arylsulfatase A-like enzyme
MRLGRASDTPQGGPELGRLSAAEALIGGWIAAALVDVVLLAALTRGGKLSPFSRGLVYLFAGGQALVIGVAMAAAVLFFTRVLAPRLRPAATWGWCLASVAASCMGLYFLRDDLAGALSQAFGEWDEPWVEALSCALVAQVVPVSAWLATRLARGFWRALPALAGLGLLVGNYFVLEGDYPAVHLIVGEAGATCVGCAAVGLPLGRRRAPRVAVAAFAVVVAALAAVVRPPSPIVTTLSRAWTNALGVELSRVRLGGTLEVVGDEDVYRPGFGGMDVPPTRQNVIPKDPVVIVYSVDSLRADLFAGDYAEQLPNLYALRDDAVWFRQARSAGTQTTFALTAMMTGKYPSQIFWQTRFLRAERAKRTLPADDDSIRFPAILSAAGVPTVRYSQASWLLNEFGMTRGFSEEEFVKPIAGRPSTKGKWSTGEDVLEKIDARLARTDGPLFLFFHDLDPHSPFTLGGKGETKRESWLAEVELVDARIGRLRRRLADLGIAERAILILTADHGEAFGEHGTAFHGQNLYEEQLRIPILIHVPGARARVVDDPVSLMDLGPTILDMFQLPTPRHFMGQSLVPYWLERVPNFSRPIIAEGRLRQAMVLPNGLKLIRSRREGTFEIYDLNQDPLEENNLYDEMGPEGERLMKRLVAFFEVHELKRPDYEMPWK